MVWFCAALFVVVLILGWVLLQIKKEEGAKEVEHDFLEETTKILEKQRNTRIHSTDDAKRVFDAIRKKHKE